MGVRLLILLLLVACAQEQVMTVEDNVTELNNIGFMYAQQGDNAEAKEYFEKVLSLDLAHETARKNLALIYYKEGNYDNAMIHYSMLTQLYPNKAEYHYDLAINIADNCRIKQICDLPRAIAEFEKAEQLEPGYQNAKQNIEALRQVIISLDE